MCTLSWELVAVCEEGAGLCALLLTAISMLLILISLPLSLFFVVKVVQVGPGHCKCKQ